MLSNYSFIRDELMRMLAEDELREAVLLIFANKQVSAKNLTNVFLQIGGMNS